MEIPSLKTQQPQKAVKKIVTQVLYYFVKDKFSSGFNSVVKLKSCKLHLPF